MRPLLILVVGYITGISWGLYFNISIVPAIFLGFSLLYFFSKKIDIVNKYKKYIFLAILLAFFSNMQINHLNNRYENLYKDKDEISVVGIVISKKKDTKSKTSYTIKVESINGDEKYKNTKLIMYTKLGTNIEYGRKVTFKGTYEKASEATNYKAFDYEKYLRTKNIYGLAYANDNLKISRYNYLNPILLYSNKLKLKIENNLDNILGKNSEIAKRDFATEILRIYKKIL